jgi:hypothetical protein
MCAASIARLVAKATGREIVDVPSQRVRPPLKPITLGELASLRNV